jgi:hypothetical protein
MFFPLPTDSEILSSGALGIVFHPDTRQKEEKIEGSQKRW